MRLNVSTTPGAKTEFRSPLWHLEIPAGDTRYKLAQLDDYSNLKRKDFLWYPGTTLKLKARVSSPEIPGTWGFGIWNDPFAMSIGLGGMKRIIPVLPNAAWFFHASPQNYLSFRDDRPSNGFLASTFSSPRRYPLNLMASLALIPFAFVKSISRILRRRLQKVILEDADLLCLDVTHWNDYSLTWEKDKASYWINGQEVFSTIFSPRGPLGLVIWIDNQYAAYKPTGEIKAGALVTEAPAWLEFEQATINDYQLNTLSSSN